jgi:hypothetical protein
MKLNLKREEVEKLIVHDLTVVQGADLREDWLTLEAECTKRGELIEKLDWVVQAVESSNHGACPVCNKLAFAEGHAKRCKLFKAMLAVSEWRKEQMK